MESFVEYCKNYIIDHIEGFEGYKTSGLDLKNEITQTMNCDGTATYSRNDAVEYLREWWKEAAAYYDYHKDNFGEAPVNPFDNAEAYMVCMVIHGCSDILGQCKCIITREYDLFVITKKIISQIKKEVEQVISISF